MTEAFRSLVTVVLFIGILGILVIVHELGHFLVARFFKVRVLEFGVGFPPRAKVLRNIGETVYTLNWLPLGGFVKLEGEDGDTPDDPRSFSAQSLPKRLLILLAGVVMNLVMAFAIFTGITLAGDPAAGVRIGYVEPGSPAAIAGIQVGDVIEQVEGQIYSAFSADSITGDLRSHAGQTVHLQIRRGDEVLAVTATLRTLEEIAGADPPKGVLGIARMSMRITPDVVRYDPVTAVGLGVSRTADAMGLIVNGVGSLVGAIITRPTEAPPAAGPVGIAFQIGEVFWNLGPIFTLYLAGLLSANLAVVNILPFPPLDGGRMLLIVVKRFAGARISLRAERLTYVLGFALLLTFLVWVTAFDIARQLSGGS